MTLKCEELSVHKLFKHYTQIMIPKYQRGYNWNKKQVLQFIDDLERCFDSDVNDKELHHFFGGIVAIASKNSENNDDVLEVIDGQQRLSTFVLFVAQIINSVEKYINEFKENLSEEHVKRLRKFSNGLRFNYVFYKDDFGITEEDELKLLPTVNDTDCFRNVIEGNLITKNQYKRDSHRSIVEAYKTLEKFVQGKIVNLKKPIVVFRNLERIRKVMEDNCRLIFITTPDRDYAYQYFQVLNDRGMRLSTGNLLKADTLRLMEENGASDRTTDLALLWDEILADKPEETDKNLQTVYLARVGKRPNKLDLSKQFKDNVLMINELRTNSKYGLRLQNKVQKIVDDVSTIRDLKKGVWVPENSEIIPWKRERLTSLVLYLKNRLVIPLLLSLTKCQPNQFYDMVVFLERFVCRYINIQKLNAGLLEEVFLEFSQKFYQKKFPKELFFRKLNNLLERETSESQFRADLLELRYQKGTLRLNLLKVFFSILENHWIHDEEDREPGDDWYEHTANLKELKLEHIYPQIYSKHWQDDELDEVVHDLGNLTLLLEKEGMVEEDQTFAEKRGMFRKSSFYLSRVIAKERNWTLNELEKRQSELIDKAVEIFFPQT